MADTRTIAKDHDSRIYHDYPPPFSQIKSLKEVVSKYTLTHLKVPNGKIFLDFVQIAEQLIDNYQVNRGAGTFETLEAGFD